MPLLFDQIVPIPTPFEVVFVRIVRLGELALVPTSAEVQAAARLMRELRFGIEGFDASMIRAAERLHNALLGLDLLSPLRLDASLQTRRQLETIMQDLENAFQRGRLVVHDGAMLRTARGEEELGARRPEVEPLPPLPPTPPPVDAPNFFSFEARFVDEVGQALGGFDVEFDAAGRAESATANPAGIARLDGVSSSSAAIRVTDLEALEGALDPRWTAPRSGPAPKGLNRHEVMFDGSDFGATPLKPEVTNTIVLKPPLGTIALELLDKTGRKRHVDCPYEISGPTRFSGRTDENGRLRHDGVFPGDYELKLTLTHDLETTRLTDAHTIPVVVQRTALAASQVRFVGAVPRVVMARFRGMLFEVNKAFLLPSAVPHLKRLRQFYVENNPSELLIVGHTDTSGEVDFNEKLSLERADSVHAYLLDDVEAWLKFYGSAISEKKRWGSAEDLMMIGALPDFPGKDPDEDPVRWFQRTRGLVVDGVAGPATRRRLITEYMDLDQTSLAQGEFDIRITTHGCGENFPLEESGEQLDVSPLDGKRDPVDRRVELFFFDPDFGIVPPPPGKISKPGSTEYPTWRARAEQIADIPILPLRLLQLWVTEPHIEAANDIELVIDSEEGEELRRELMPPICSGPGPCHSFVLREPEKSQVCVLELRAAEVRVAPLMRLDLPQMTVAFDTQDAALCATALILASNGPPPPPLSGAENFPPDADAEPTLPARL